MGGYAALLLAIGGCTGLEYYDPDALDKDRSTPTPSDPSPPTTVDTASSPVDTGTGEGPDTPGTPGTGTPGTGTPGTGTPGTPGTDTGGTGGTTVPPPPIDLVSVSPHYGPTTGGTRVVATGTFDATTEIRFDGVPGTIVSATATEITVDTPPGTAGWADVEAVSGSRTDPLPSGFQYWVDGTGQGGAFGWVGYVELVGGFWVGNPPDTGEALVGFGTPSGWELWRDYTAVMDTCEFNTAGQAVPVPYDPGAVAITLSSGGTVATVPEDLSVGPGVFRDLALTANVEVVPGAVYDLDPVAGNADWPGFGVPAFVQVPPAFDVTSPDLGRPSNPVDVTRSFTLTWNGSGGDYVLIWILRQYETLGGWVNDGVVTCAVSDTGTFTIPASAWPNWYANDFLHVVVGRVYESAAVLPHDNSEVRVGGVYWYYGGADTIR